MGSLVCAFFLIVVGAAAVPPSSSSVTVTEQPSETATQFYMRWRFTAQTAKSLDEITPFLTAEMKDEFTMEPDSAKAGTLEMMKRAYSLQTEVKVVKETATPSGATLFLEALDRDKQPVVSSVAIVKERGAWRMTGEVERWSPKRH